MATMRLKATVSYDGSAYAGWQRQSNAHSIQAVIEKALSKLHKHPVEIIASGRTDAQVHAIAQVFHFDSDKVIDEEHWVRALNSMLPKDIRMQHLEPVSDAFHARFDAIGKRYEYVLCQSVCNPFYQKYMGFDWKQLDVAYMQECAQVFIGTHDFTSFTSAKIDPRKSRTKTIWQLEIKEEGDTIRFIFEGNGFLRYMVRMLTQTLIEAGKHELSKEDLAAMLEAKDKNISHYKADPQGLYLVQVLY